MEVGGRRREKDNSVQMEKVLPGSQPSLISDLWQGGQGIFHQPTGQEKAPLPFSPPPQAERGLWREPAGGGRGAECG